MVTLFSPQCGECIHCLSPKTNLCLAIREQQNHGYLPDGTTRLSRGGEPIRHFMGTSTFAEYTVMPEIALAKVSPEAPLDRACLFACGLSTGLGAAMFTAKVEPGSTCVVFGAGMVGLGAVAGCRLQGAERIVCVDLSRGPARAGPRPGRDRRHARGGATPSIDDPRDDRRLRRRLHVRGDGHRRGHGAGGRGGAHGLGSRTVCGVAGKGETLDIVPRLLITGRRVAGSSFGGVKGRDQVPQLVERYLDGDIDVDPFISHR